MSQAKFNGFSHSQQNYLIDIKTLQFSVRDYQNGKKIALNILDNYVVNSFLYTFY